MKPSRQLSRLECSANCAMPLIVLNTAVAEQLTKFKADVDALIEKGVKKDEAILQIIRKFIIESKAIRFEGNGYSEQWHKEAASRGLKGITSVTSAIREYINPDNVKLFTTFGVMSSSELESRYEIKNEMFLKKVQIEARVLGDLATNHIIPTAILYQNELIENVKGIKELFPEEYETVSASERKTILKISDHVNAIREQVTAMVDARKKWNAVEDIVKRAEGYETEVRPFISSIRTHIDKLELIIDDRLWTLPKYRELFTI